MLNGQNVLVENVREWTVDANGIHVINEDTETRKVGEEMKSFTHEVKKWFNLAGVFTFSEEFKD
jgi:hypothetical protein